MATLQSMTLSETEMVGGYSGKSSTDAVFHFLEKENRRILDDYKVEMWKEMRYAKMQRRLTFQPLEYVSFWARMHSFFYKH